MMSMGLISKKAVFPIFLIIGILLPMMASAGALQKLAIEDMAKLADVIVVGLVEKKECAWVDKHIETTIRIQANEYWKGNLGSTIELTQMGGEVVKPLPMAMHADGAPRFFEGERVILFLEKPKAIRSATPPPAGARISDKLNSSMQVLGWAQGKYTIIADPKTGEDKAVCLGMQNVRVVDKREMDKLCAVAAEYEKLRLKNKGIAAGSKESATKSAPKEPNPKIEDIASQGYTSITPHISVKDMASLSLETQASIQKFKAQVLENIKK